MRRRKNQNGETRYTPQSMTYYRDRDDDITKKRELALAFLDNPTRDTFAELVGFKGFWATEARRSIDYYVDDVVLTDGQTLQDIADAVEDAQNVPDNIEHVEDLNGFGWATSTELLNALRPDRFAIFNKRAVSGLTALGYDPPNPQYATTAEYWDFVHMIEDAIEQYDLIIVYEESTVVPRLTDPTDFEVADNLFNTHYADETDFDLADIREERAGGADIAIPEELEQEIEAVVSGNVTYRDLEDFIYSAIRNELQRI